jgi:hypothetical protein
MSTEPSPIAGGGGIASSYQQQFNTAYYAAQDPRKQPLYNSRPGGANANVAQLSQADTLALINSLIAAGVTIDEQIDYWGWDPYTVMSLRQVQGIGWVEPGLGNVDLAIVVTPGEFSGTPPAGAIITSTNITSYPPFPPTAPALPATAPDPVGPLEIGPYYGVIGTDPPATYTDSRGTFKLVQIPSAFPIAGGTLETFYQLT